MGLIRIVKSDDRRKVTNLLSVSRVRDTAIERRAAKIVADVRANRDRAPRRYANELDGLKGSIEVPQKEWERTAEAVPPDLRRALRQLRGTSATWHAHRCREPFARR